MDAHPAGLHDPKCSSDGARLNELQKIPQTVENTLQGRARSDFQHDDSSAFLRRKPEHLAKISVESDECSPFCPAYLEQILVGNALEVLISNSHHIVARRPDEFLATTSYIFVELELHAT